MSRFHSQITQCTVAANQEWEELCSQLAEQYVPGVKTAIERRADLGKNDAYVNITELSDRKDHRLIGFRMAKVWKEKSFPGFSFDYWANGACTMHVTWLANSSSSSEYLQQITTRTRAGIERQEALRAEKRRAWEDGCQELAAKYCPELKKAIERRAQARMYDAYINIKDLEDRRDHRWVVPEMIKIWEGQKFDDELEFAGFTFEYLKNKNRTIRVHWYPSDQM